MATISLTKGQKIDLTKTNPGLTKLMVGLGWDEAPRKRGFFGAAPQEIDCDASAVLLDDKDHLTRKERLVYFGNLRSNCESVIHSGDNLTGAGDGDDEVINVDLSRVPTDVKKILFTVNIYDCLKRKQDFGMIQNAFIRIANPASNQELCRFNLTEDYKGKTALIVAEVYRHNGEWKFAALGESTTDATIGDMVRRYQ